ncbi:hypothetical protein AWB85_19105 [Mycobacteroides immunogenum]|uniref:Uncharacterized protein n=1 Tax=Mycobacteroides immunogenum TaxID=83262 RepID=A0A179VD05_9MYCO|nr:hypothetical protein AWB85_19105 [Mycobacteroides immunogenum]
MRGRQRTDLFRELGERPVVFGSENALLKTQLADSHLENFKIGYFLNHRGRRIMAVLMRMLRMFVTHANILLFKNQAACSQRSGISVCKVSKSGPEYSGQRSRILNRTM